ncbi:MAG TPA: hypothetical protein VGN14_17210 [Candidatus Elarobacter sp.]|jgi:hypothetical protein
MLTKALIAGAFALLLFTGCSGGGGLFAQPKPTDFPTGYCLVPPIPGTLISPAPNATNVPKTVGTITFSVGNAGLIGGTLTLINTANQTSITAGPVTGTAANASATIPVLQPNTTYNASVSNTIPGDACNPRTAVLGSFTTGP